MINNKIQPKIVIISGAESTGKSELTKLLSEHYNAPFYPEFAREYISGLNRKYNFSDVGIIASKQLEQYNNAINSNNKIIFFDTWLIVTKVWFEFVYEVCPQNLVNNIKQAKLSGFLLCNTDLPWVPDAVRENGGKKRQTLHNQYKNEILNFKFNYSLISGTGDNRLKVAIKAIENQFM